MERIGYALLALGIGLVFTAGWIEGTFGHFSTHGAYVVYKLGTLLAAVAWLVFACLFVGRGIRWARRRVRRAA